MYLLYCDETNFEKKVGDFFVYGGVVISPGSANKISAEIDGLRTTLGVPQDYVLKFNPGPENFTVADCLRPILLKNPMAICGW